MPAGLQWEFYGPMFVENWTVPSFDLAKAKALLKEANYKGDPIPYRLLNNYYTNQVQTAQIMVEQWKAVGLNVAIEMKENWGQILGRFPGRGICENSNSSWFNDPVASLAALAAGRRARAARSNESTSDCAARMSFPGGPITTTSRSNAPSASPPPAHGCHAAHADKAHPRGADSHRRISSRARSVPSRS